MKWISYFGIPWIFLSFEMSRAAVIDSGARASSPGTLQAPSMTSAEEKRAYLELTGRDFSKLSESALYSELIASYQAKNEIQFYAQLDTFLAKYKRSSFADNALFLAGRLALEKKNYAKSIHYFDSVIKRYPTSNKVVSAELSKGIAYQKMNLISMALRVFDRVQKNFPGSPESFRAEAEAKLLRAN
jgi:TolA-binding protein